MKFLEKNLEDIIWEAYNQGKRNELASRGLIIKGELLRQETLGNYGTPDLIEINNCVDTIDSVVIYELKLDEINVKALMQACRYLTGIKRIFNDRPIEYKICLIGNKVDLESDFVFLYNQLDFVTILTYDFQFDGIHFKEIEKCWYKKNENFEENMYEVLFNKTLPF